MTIKIQPHGIETECTSQESLFQCIRRAGINITGICGGNGTCRKCVIELVAGRLEFFDGVPDFRRPSSIERSNLYYSCLVYPVEKCVISIPASSLEEGFKTQTYFREELAAGEPTVNLLSSSASESSFNNIYADTEAVLNGLKTDKFSKINSFDTMVLKKLAGFLRQNEWQISLAVYRGEVVQIGTLEDNYYAAAVDVGSTKIAVYLLDIKSGKTIFSGGILNPQAAYGADIVSRLSSAVKDSETGKRLQKLVVEKINVLIEELCTKNNIDKYKIVFSVFVGNTAMHHLLLGLELGQLLEPPYVPVTSSSLEFKTRELGFNLSPGAYGYFLPNVAGYVGADHVSMLLASGALEDNDYVMYIDIGTNTELCLTTQREFYSLSAPSGPAFEGAHIRYGMRALPGAIDTAYAENSDKIGYTTIGNIAPKGICGSGIIDLLTIAYKLEIVDWRGRLREHKMVKVIDGEKRFYIDLDKKIYLSQKDIREFQLAKGAITSGIYALAQEAGIELGKINKLIIAGAFGSYINVGNAIRIGLFPFSPNIHYEQVGNAAGAGACMAAVDKKMREKIRKIKERIVYIELVKLQGFKELFARSTYLGNQLVETFTD